VNLSLIHVHKDALFSYKSRIGYQVNLYLLTQIPNFKRNPISLPHLDLNYQTWSQRPKIVQEHMYGIREQKILNFQMLKWKNFELGQI